MALPDLNQNDFTRLTLTRQLQQAEALLEDTPTTLIGSSFGGLAGVWLGDRHPQIDRLILLAPAFQFLDHWLPKLGDDTLQQWQKQGYISVYHYSEQRELSLHYEFVTDAKTYDPQTLTRRIPTLILHGIHDEVIPITASREFVASRPWIHLQELESDHALSNVLPDIWQAIQLFCGLEPDMPTVTDQPSDPGPSEPLPKEKALGDQAPDTQIPKE